MGVVLAVPAIFSAISVKKNEDQKDEERAEAQKMIDELMAQERADEVQGQADAAAAKDLMTAEVSQRIESWKTICNDAQAHYHLLVNEWQSVGVGESSNINFELGYAIAELTFLAAYLRGHSMETIREAKLREGSSSLDDDKFLAELTRAKDHLRKAKEPAQVIRELTQSLSATLADIDNGSFVPLFGALVTWTTATNAEIEGLKGELQTTSDALVALTESRKNTIDDIGSHFDISFGDFIGGVASIFVGSIDDGWPAYIESTRSTLAQINSNTHQTKTKQGIAQAKIEAYVPLVEDVNNLQKLVADDRQKMSDVEKALVGLDTKINNYFLSAQDAVELFKVISNPEKEYTSTAKLVSTMAKACIDMLDIDFVSILPLLRVMVGQLKQVKIPAPDLSDIAREHGSSSGITEVDANAAVQEASDGLDKSRSSSLIELFELPNFVLPEVEEKSMQEPTEYQTQGLAEIESAGVDQAYTP